MKKVLIIEDEILARLGLRQLLDWKQLGYLLLDDARDGEEALEAIKKLHPNIILLDMNIPKINGLQILEYVRNHNLDIKIIIISCNEEFETVRAAMKLGAVDYLRKLNLSPEELLLILRKCDSAGSSKLQESLKTHVTELRFEEILENNGKDAFFNAEEYAAALCVLNQQEKLFYPMCDWLKRRFKEQEISFVQIIKGMQCGYFLLKDVREKSALIKMQQELCEETGGTVYIGVCEQGMRTGQEICDAIMLAEQIMLLSYYDENKKICWFRERIPCSNYSPKGIHEKVALLKTAVSNFDLSGINRSISVIFEFIRQTKYTRIHVLRRVLMDMLGIFSMQAQALEGAIEEIEVRHDNCHYQKVMTMNSLKMIEEWFLEFAGAFYSEFLVRHKCSASDILEKAIGYICSHMDRQITLADTAKETGVSSAYLSTVFKKEIGQNFIEYVNRLKIEEAKKMLETGKYVYQVSQCLGFENVTYFSKVFKKYAGVSADSWRKGGGREAGQTGDV